ncbi:NRAMP family divalent metal transporter [Roseicella aquatilis]|uniref:Divalent metal cation transporter n=1 Tax=Roseicella aquatilis TaxID=2527868 RepID=A0A4R4DTJ3_9PROT|nr:divalent metal cation transporter [Roseicella aquatilis]TCZ66159.1 divalent metal cation transporter [Roseicella aquatilis]
MRDGGIGPDAPPAAAPAGPKRKGLLARLGPGLITGASDDDPSGIATYSQAGAQFGTALCWVMLFCFPLMASIQEICARIGRVTGHGIAGNLRAHGPRWLLHPIVGLLLVANTANLGADLGAMAAALQLLVGGPAGLYVVGFAVLCTVLEVTARYERYVAFLTWTSFVLLAYAAVVLVVEVPWPQVLHDLLVPRLSLQRDYVLLVVAVLGTTITPYCFFWQASQEAEDERVNPAAHPLLDAPEEAPAEIGRMRLDTWLGMGYSNLISLFIMISAAATLHTQGATRIESSAQAAEALRPIAGDFAFALFAAGIIGIGLLAVPVLAGSGAYALGEALGWRTGLGRRPRDARGFYATIAISTLLGIGFNFAGLDPIRALFWAAVINGVVAVPLMAAIMLLAMRREVMGRFVLPRWLWAMGWLSTGAMAVAVAVAVMVVAW